ncbi:hypothetical protein FHW12_001692 [Dokdonella fugitiva]|uniref:Uncharacterized protein n=1 Tax=Dokdonella fugitiva TaxID=328517 RepID=A0A839F1U5_9GAMM|nr:hypothetical protein [Dokdonella fugitiva]MBA8887478.1 hypothetical protein [Dokdonella fugitiva]
MQPRHPACAATDPAATRVATDLLYNVAGLDAAILDFAAERWRKNLDAFARLVACGSPLALVLLSIDLATEATADGFAFAQRLCGVLDPAVVDSSLAVS